jgi:hypothetical protein
MNVLVQLVPVEADPSAAHLKIISLLRSRVVQSREVYQRYRELAPVSEHDPHAELIKPHLLRPHISGERTHPMSPESNTISSS